MSTSPGEMAWQMAMEISPILLIGGVAASVGGVIPIVTLTEGANLVVALIQSGGIPSLNQAFARYKVLPGAQLINNQVSTMPFANQSVAANAIISDAVGVSYRMECPAGPNSGGSALRLFTMMSLKTTLQQHILAGGLFTCITPSAIVSNMLLLRMHDISADGGNTQAQLTWQLDFWAPLVTLQQAQQAQNASMQALTNGVQSSSALSGSLASFGAGSALAVGNPFSLLTGAFSPPPAVQ